ncbi:hypothetical protein [Gemella sp.]
MSNNNNNNNNTKPNNNNQNYSNYNQNDYNSQNSYNNQQQNYNNQGYQEDFNQYYQNYNNSNQQYQNNQQYDYSNQNYQNNNQYNHTNQQYNYQQYQNYSGSTNNQQYQNYNSTNNQQYQSYNNTNGQQGYNQQYQNYAGYQNINTQYNEQVSNNNSLNLNKKKKSKFISVFSSILIFGLITIGSAYSYSKYTNKPISNIIPLLKKNTTEEKNSSKPVEQKKEESISQFTNSQLALIGRAYVHNSTDSHVETLKPDTYFTMEEKNGGYLTSFGTLGSNMLVRRIDNGIEIKVIDYDKPVGQRDFKLFKKVTYKEIQETFKKEDMDKINKTIAEYKNTNNYLSGKYKIND